MEIIVWAYQIVPGQDELLFFAETEEACRNAALEQRAELKQRDPEDYAEMPAMALHEFTLRPMTAGELVAVLNGDANIIGACAADRRLVGLIDD